MQREFIVNANRKLLQESKGKADGKIALDIIEDIVAHFDNRNKNEWTASQKYAGIRELLRRCAVKDWKGLDFNYDKHNELNKLVIVKSVKFYNEY